MSPVQIAIEPTSPKTLSVNQPDGSDAAFRQTGYRGYSFIPAPLNAFLKSTGPVTFQARTVVFSPPDTVLEVYEDRVKTLQEAAEEEGIKPRPASLPAFFKFIHAASFKVRPAALFLLDDGCYAAIWRNEAWRLNVKFLGDDNAEYVLLDRTEDLPKGKSGSVTFDELNNLIVADNIKPLLQA